MADAENCFLSLCPPTLSARRYGRVCFNGGKAQFHNRKSDDVINIDTRTRCTHTPVDWLRSEGKPQQNQMKMTKLNNARTAISLWPTESNLETQQRILFIVIFVVNAIKVYTPNNYMKHAIPFHSPLNCVWCALSALSALLLQARAVVHRE